jgi:23S rRNA (cytosine1962-C5)-methyltransferase
MKAQTLRVRLRPTAETIVRGGHPWIFADSIKEQNREGAAGELAVVFDRKDKFLALGFYDPESPIRIRVVHVGKPVKIDEAFWRARFELATGKRKFGAETNGYRCVHGENDGFPGLVVDRYGDTFVVKIYTAAWVERVEQVASFINGERVILRASRNLQIEMKILRGSEPEGPIVFLENNLRFEADVLRGQKTGFFLDQRENRAVVETLSKGRDVLNAFSFSGGFSVYAARGGARSVTDIDISAHALASAKRNFELNGLMTKHETVQADTFEWLARKVDRKFGLIVLDPPSLAKREADKEGALRAYRQLARMALGWLEPGAILVAASCSAHVSPEEFFSVMAELRLKEIRRTENPADHPATFAEARYLKCIYLKVAS